MDTEEEFEKLRTLTQERGVILLVAILYPRDYAYLKNLGYRELSDHSAPLSERVSLLLKSEQERHGL